MSVRRNSTNQNGEIPLPGSGADEPVPEGRIELGSPPEIDITTDRLGPLLLERRRAMGLKIEEIAEDIKVKADYLRAIEAEEFHTLPTPEYARMFVKAYAERLGFNVSEVYALLDLNEPSLAAPVKPKVMVGPAAAEAPTELAGPLPGIQTTEPGGTPKIPTGPGLWIGIVVVVIVLSVIGWFVVQNGDGPEETSDLEPAEQTTAAITSPIPPVQEMVQEVEQVIPIAQADSMHMAVFFERDTWTSLTADGEIVERKVFGVNDTLRATAAVSFRLSLAHTGGVTATVNDFPMRKFADWCARLEGHLITRDTAESWLTLNGNGEPAQAGATPAAQDGGADEGSP